MSLRQGSTSPFFPLTSGNPRYNRGMRFLLIALLSLAGSANASDICNRNKETILDALQRAENRIAFQNHGGLFNGGVCWWHSRLQRSSVYLATYAPEKPKPSFNEAVKLVRDLTFMRSVVEIPGYSNFFDFTRDFQSVVQRELNRWQVRDGFINQQWIRGVSGHWDIPAEDLRSQMEYIYESFLEAPAGIWSMIQYKGVVSHAMLIVGAERTTKGFNLSVIESNKPDETRLIRYQYGDTHLNFANTISLFGPSGFVPYLGFRKDFVKIDSAIAEYCRP